jgi:hypothetical protein
LNRLRLKVRRGEPPGAASGPFAIPFDLRLEHFDSLHLRWEAIGSRIIKKHGCLDAHEF